MTRDPQEDVPARFRRQMRTADLLRGCLALALGGGLIAYCFAAPGTRGYVAAALLVVSGTWIVLLLRTIGQLRRARTSSALLKEGRIEEAHQELLGALDSLSPLRSIKILACHYLAVAAHLGRRYGETAAICRELLAHPLGAMANLGTATRLILVDSLLMLDEFDAAAPVIQQIGASPLSLTDRLTFLPIELRYQLATDQAAQAVESLPSKARLAELLDSSAAALTHALLAEACMRMKLTPQHEYLLRRAALLADLQPIVTRYRPILQNLNVEAAGPDPLELTDPNPRP